MRSEERLESDFLAVHDRVSILIDILMMLLALRMC